MASIQALLLLQERKDGLVHDLTTVVSPGSPNRDRLLGEVADLVRKNDDFVLLSGSEFAFRPGWVEEAKGKRLAWEAAMGWC